MPKVDFVHLRVHSAYSLSEGAIRVKDLVKICGDQNMPAAAITDTNNLFGALEFSLAARGAGVQPIPGLQLNVRAPDKRQANSLAQAPPPDQIVLLAQNDAGYENLMRLTSKAFLESGGAEDPQVDLEDLEAWNEGLIALTGGIHGPVGRLLLAGQEEEAEEVLVKLARIFDGRLYVELMRHFLADEDRIEAPLIELAYRHDLPLVATNECFFTDKKMFEAHDALLCIAGGTYVSQTERRRLTEDHRFKSAAEMRELFADIPEALDNTLIIAQRCSTMVERKPPLLPVYTKLEGRSEEEALAEMSRVGLQERLEAQIFTADMDNEARTDAAKPYFERLEYELGVIAQMGFPGYFLIVADFIQWTKDRGIPVGPGRGSGAGSVVAWALTITDLDPLRWDLLFERFLNPERVSMPDFDIDFCQDRRDEVIRYVQQEYGNNRVAQIITFGKLQARAVLRDVGRVLEMPYGQVDRICKLVPNNPAKPVTLQQAIDGEPLLQQMQFDDPSVKTLIQTALPLEGLFRHASTHAAGVVIGDRPLTELVPLYRDPRSDMPVTQFNMKFVEQAGLVKFDFLGLKTLTVIDRAKELIDARKDREGDPLDISALPLDDNKTYEMLCRADTVGVFQLESSGMRDVLKKLRPDRFEDIIAVVALYRPGPMDNIPTYIKRKHGEEVPEYPHEKLEPVLKETFGIPVYQEQVMQMAQVLAGYTLGGADLLRRAMGKKIQSEMDAQRQSFVEGAGENSDVEPKKANEIFDLINAFAGYGFNKSHAAAYALVAYQTAWLKANYPVEFLAASMTLDLHNTDKLDVFRAEMGRQDIELLTPDVNSSQVRFSVEEGSEGERKVRYALAALKNVGAQAMEAIVREREENGPYADIFDFADRLDPRAVNKKALENLSKAGAFDSLNPNRRQILESLDVLVAHASAIIADKESNQVSLFGDTLAEASRPKLRDVPDWPQQVRLNQEFDAVGFYLSAHPLEAYAKTCRKLGVVDWRDVGSGRIRGSTAYLAGIVGARRITTTSRGSKMAFVQMSDATGSYEVTMFQEVLNSALELLDAGEPLMLSVEVQNRGDGEEPRLTALSVRSLEEQAANAADGMEVYLSTQDSVSHLSNLLHEHGKRGRGLVKIQLKDRPEGDVEIELSETFKIDAPLRQAVKSIPGIIDVQDL